MTEALRGAGRGRLCALFVFALVAATAAPAVYAQTTAKKEKASATRKRSGAAAKTPPGGGARRAPAPLGDPLRRRGLSDLGYLKEKGESSTGVLRSQSRLSAAGGKTGTSPLDRWSMTKQKQTTRAWQKAREHDNRGRSLLPKP